MNASGISSLIRGTDDNDRRRNGSPALSEGGSAFAKLLSSLGGTAGGTEAAAPAVPVAQSPDPADQLIELVGAYQENLGQLRDRLKGVLEALQIDAPGSNVAIQQNLNGELIVTGELNKKSELQAALNSDPQFRELFQLVSKQATQIDVEQKAANSTGNPAVFVGNNALRLPPRFALELSGGSIRPRVE